MNGVLMDEQSTLVGGVDEGEGGSGVEEGGDDGGGDDDLLFG